MALHLPRRAILRVLATTLLFPLAVLLLGFWEQQRSTADIPELEAQRIEMTQAVAAIEARVGEPLSRAPRFIRNGKTYIGQLALDQARDALSDVDIAITVASARRILPPVVIITAGLTMGLSALVLLAGALLGRTGRMSRDVLVHGFSFVRRVLPAILAAQVVFATVAAVAAMAFEAAALLHPGQTSAGEIKLAFLAGLGILISLWVAGSTALQLRRTMAAFEPNPLSILGRVVSPAEAPGLWRILDHLAKQLNALRPDNVVVGLTEGFFVSSGPKVLEPSGAQLSGRTLYLPLPYLPLLRLEEVASIIGHELAHFSGGDTEYSLRFLPIYAGVGRSLDAVATGGADGRGAGSFLLTPALQLGIFLMDQFHHAVRHWSRRREFAADVAGASVTSPDATARALLRTSAIQPRIVEVLQTVGQDPRSAPADLVAEVLHRAIAQGLDHPAAHLDEQQPHPTDTHPPTRERIAALDRQLDPALLAAAVAVPPLEALNRLDAYFADAATLCRDATSDFLAVVHRNADAYHQSLEATAAAVGGEEYVVREGRRAVGLFWIIFGLAMSLVLIVAARWLLPELDTMSQVFAVGAGLAVGPGTVGYGFFVLRQDGRPFLILSSKDLAVPGLDRPIAWDDVADLDLTFNHSVVSVRLLLPPEASFPQRLTGPRRAKLDPKRRIVTVSGVLPRSMKPQQFVDLMSSYYQAAEARRLLAREQATASPQTELSNLSARDEGRSLN